MKIESVVVKNLRSVRDANVGLDDYTCLVGPNGAGKSTLLCALNMFFRETENATTNLVSLVPEDFHQRDTSEPIEITVTFTDLNDAAKEDFKEYFRHGKLIISAKADFDVATGRAEVRQFGQRLAMGAFKPYFKALGDGEKVSLLKEIYTTLLVDFPDLPPPGTKDAMTEALKAYEAARQDLCVLIPSEDQFYGVTRGSNRLEKYVQWVYVPAVKDVTEEQTEAKNTALGKLLARTVRAKVNFDEAVKTLLAEARAKYEQLLAENQQELDGVSKSLKDRLVQWAHPDATLKLAWQQDPQKSVRIEEPFAKLVAGEGDFEGELSRFGHGFQRSYLLALLQELATGSDVDSPTLILGCEEPELYQHPPQARHLSAILSRLSEGNAQVIVTTHSPAFVTGEHFEHVRMVRRDPATKRSSVLSLSHQTIADRYAGAVGNALVKPAGGLAKVHQMLQVGLSEMFFTQRLVLVEGLEDVACITAWLHLTDRIEDFRRAGCHIVPANGKSEIIRPLIIAQGLEIPVFVVFDADSDKIAKEAQRLNHERDNRALLQLLGVPQDQLFPTDPIWGGTHAVWPQDIGVMIKSDLLQTLGEAEYEKVLNTARAAFDNESGLEKNTMFVSQKLALALDSGGRSATLDKLCDSILQFCAA